MSLSNNFPTVSPTLNLNFAAAGRLDSRVTFTRSSTATYVNQIGLIQSAAVNEPRFDYDPVTLAARGLLIEESRTNLALYSEDFSNASWAQSYLTENITTNSATAPNGTVTADTISDSSGNSEFAVGQQISVTPNVPYTFSVFAKANGSSFLYLRYYGNTELFYYTSIFDLSNGTVTKSQIGSSASGGSTTITAMGNGWYRLTVTATVNSGTLVPMIGIAASGTDTIGSFGQINVNGTGSRSCYIWGAQLESGAFSTSYVSTVAASVTRSADVASVNTLSPFYNAVEGTLFAEAANIGTSTTASAASLNNGTADNSLWIGVVGGTTTGRAQGIVSGSAVATLDSAGVYSSGSTARGAFAFKQNDFASCFNGGTVQTDTSGNLPTVTTLSLGALPNGERFFNGHLRRVTYYSARLTNAQLQALTL